MTRTLCLLLVVFFAPHSFCQTASPIPDKDGMVLSRGWDSPMQGDSQTLKDLGRLLSTFSKPAPTTGPATDLSIFQGITYLMPLPKALDVLGLKGRIPSRSKLVCPGFPKDSCFYVAFDGNFEGHYNRLYFVLDRADQVLCVELADEKPDKRDRITPDKGDWHTYDFVNAVRRRRRSCSSSTRFFTRAKVQAGAKFPTAATGHRSLPVRVCFASIPSCFSRTWRSAMRLFRL